MRVLLLDIETAPHKVYAWGLFDQRIATNQIVEPGYTLCYSARWLGERETFFDSVNQSKPRTMLKGIHKLVSDADAVCHYNGKTFDIPTLIGEWIFHHMPPPAPYKQIDLLTTMRQAKVASRKLDYITQRLGIGQKVQHKGMPLWHGCMTGDQACWRIMERYNRRDVKLLQELHDEILPWIKNYPNRGIYDGKHCCPKCSGTKFQSRGNYWVTRYKSYPQAQCSKCKTWLYLIEGKFQKGLQGWREAA